MKKKMTGKEYDEIILKPAKRLLDALKKKPSRQQLWQIKQRESGRCICCGDKRVTASYCRDCQDKRNKNQKAWKAARK